MLLIARRRRLLRRNSMVLIGKSPDTCSFTRLAAHALQV